MRSVVILANLTTPCSKMQPVSGNQRPDLVKSLMNMSLVLRVPREIHPCRSSSKVSHLPMLLKLVVQNSTFYSLFTRCKILSACHTKWHLYVQQCSVPPVFFGLRNRLRATTAGTFWTFQLPKSAWTLQCFVHFDYMCFAPWRHRLLDVSTS